MYVINLISKSNLNDKNDYGYWTGEQYIVQGEPYPICDSTVSEKTKIYKIYKRAEQSAKLAIDKYGYVDDYEIVDLNNTNSKNKD